MQPEFSDQILYSFLTGGLCATSTTTTTPSSFNSYTIEETISQERVHASLRNHKEAERRRRERINSHLNKLRNLLSCSSKTDKATLLAKVVQRVKELKQQTLEISKETLPLETDEISVLKFEDFSDDDDGRIMLKVSFSCEDRPDLLQDLVEILKSLEMKTLCADMTTISGRIRNVLVVVADKEHYSVDPVHFLKNALKSLLERSSKTVMMIGRGGGGERSKRRRVVDHIIMV